MTDHMTKQEDQLPVEVLLVQHAKSPIAERVSSSMIYLQTSLNISNWLLFWNK